MIKKMKNLSAIRKEDWFVLPHDPIQELSENLWRVEGDTPHLPLRRVMSVVRLQDERLLIHSAIALDDEAMKKLDSWGTPSILLIPHARHLTDAPRYKYCYPSLRVYAPPAVVNKAREVVKVDGTFADAPLDSSASLELLDGTAEAEGALLVHSSDGTSVILNEVVFDLEPPKSSIVRVAMKVAGFGPGPRVPPVAKFELVKNDESLAQHLERLAAIPDLVRLIVGHGRMSEGPAAAAALRQAATTL